MSLSIEDIIKNIDNDDKCQAVIELVESLDLQRLILDNELGRTAHIQIEETKNKEHWKSKAARYEKALREIGRHVCTSACLTCREVVQKIAIEALEG